MSPFATIPEALQALREGRLIVLTDDEDRENEGDLVVAAELITPQQVAFMAKKGSGLVCLTLDGPICDQLLLSPQSLVNRTRYGTAFTVSIEAAQGVTTGISAADRVTTIRAAMNPDATPDDLHRPGHVFPIRARQGGVLVRAGQTEGSVDLCRLAGLRPGAVICEVMNEDGTMARLPQLEELCREHDLPLVSVAQIIEHRRRTERLVTCEVSAPLPTYTGEWKIHYYRSLVDDTPNVALTMGFEAGQPQEEPMLVRVHSGCLTGDVFGSIRCDCGSQIHRAMERIGREGRGAILYLPQEGRGIGLGAKLHAYRLQDEGLDTVEANEKLGFQADHREYGIGAQVLVDLGIHRLRLMTNNPHKYASLAGYGLEIVERVPLVVAPTSASRRYLETKRIKMGHDLPASTDEEPNAAPCGTAGPREWE